MIGREVYLRQLRDLLSGDPARVREANRALYGLLVQGGTPSEPALTAQRREADLVLAEVP